MNSSKQVMATFAPWIFIFLWSSGFVAAKYVHPYAGPFTFLSIRYLSAAVILILVALVQRKKFNLTWTKIWHAALVGFFLHFLYIGGIFFAISLGVTSGITSVIISLQPVLVSLLAIPMLGERFKLIEAVGLALGVVGVGLLLLPKLFQGDLTPQFSTIGIIACVVGLLGTTLGYLTQKKTGADMDFVTGTALQYAVTAILFVLTAGIFEDNTVQWTPELFGGLAWLVIVLSIGSVFLLFSLLKKGSAGSVSSLYYLVPPSTAIQAYFLFGETISPVGLFGMVLAALGVMLVIRETASENH